VLSEIQQFLAEPGHRRTVERAAAQRQDRDVLASLNLEKLVLGHHGDPLPGCFFLRQPDLEVVW
jgi:hypothetical protein